MSFAKLSAMSSVVYRYGQGMVTHFSGVKPHDQSIGQPLNGELLMRAESLKKRAMKASNKIFCLIVSLGGTLKLTCCMGVCLVSVVVCM